MSGLLVIGAHPDDEVFLASGTLAAGAELGASLLRPRLALLEEALP